jgi:transcriptional regulator with XRE-family HTH domain
MDESMGKRIRTLRESKQLTQTELANMVGVAKTTVSAWETGYADNIRLPALHRLLEVLGTSLGYLLYGAATGRNEPVGGHVVRRRRRRQQPR